MTRPEGNNKAVNETALQVRHLTPAESRSVSSLNRKASSGLVVHLLLLSTPSRDDAVAVGYRFTFNLDEDVHLSSQVRSQARTVRQLAAALIPRARLRRDRAGLDGQQAGLSESGSKLPHSKAAQWIVHTLPFLNSSIR